jgi:signal transduction histidine kinase/ligand-binding sensor domain-containing protein
MITGMTFRRKQVRWLLALLIGLIANRSSFALNPEDHISQYSHSVWRVDDGNFDGAPSALAQTADGYLWIGTSTGLVRFDGVRFIPWKSSGANELYRGEIFSLLGATDGSLWVGSREGLARLKNGKVTRISPSNMVRAIVEDREGTIWIARTLTWDPRPLCKVVGEGLRCYGETDGLAAGRGQSLLRDKSGTFWLGTERALYKWEKGRPLKDFYSAGLRGNAREGVVALAQAGDGTVWAGLSRANAGLGLQQIREEKSHDVVLPGFDGRRLAISSLLVAKDQSLWIGTLGQGLFRIHQNTADHFGGVDGLSSDSIESLYQDHEGTIWAATAKGIDSFHETPIVTFSAREGLSANRADNVLAIKTGSIYITNLNSLDVINKGSVHSITRKNGLPGDDVSSLFEDRNGKLWLGVDKNLAIYDGRRFETIFGREHHPPGTIMGITQDTNGDIWAASHIPQNSLVHVHNSAIVEQIPLSPSGYALSLTRDPKGGIWLGLRNGGLAHYQNGHMAYVTASQGVFSAMVASLFVDSDGTVWGTTDEGLIIGRENAFRLLRRRDGFPCDSAFDITQDIHNNHWIATACGLVMIRDGDFSHWWQHPGTSIKTRMLDVLDGFQAGSPSFEPGITSALDGTLWIANGFVVQRLDPDHLSLNTLPPPVQIEKVVADNKDYPPHDTFRLPPLTRNLEIDYTATSLVIPKRVRFRYKLSGRDKDWQDAGSRRQAFYTDLPPGNYRFQVIAANNDGVWNTTGAEIQFSVTPTYYQTNWFKCIIWVCVIAIIWFIYHIRLRQVKAQVQSRLKERMVERERIARELHDTLLQGFQGLVWRFHGIVKRMPEEDSNRVNLGKALDRAEEVLTQGRERVRDLRSDDQLPDSLEKLLADYGSELSCPDIRFRVRTLGSSQQLHPVVFGNIAQIGREAVANAFRHSAGSEITVDVIFDRACFQLSIQDDGVGIGTEILAGGRTGHWGLQGMRERAEEIGGKLTIKNRLDPGVSVDLTIPSALAYHSRGRARNGIWFRSNGA